MDLKYELDDKRKRFESIGMMAGVFCIVSGAISLFQNLVLGIGLIIAGIAILLNKFWAPILGLICSILIICYSIFSLIFTQFFPQSIISSQVGDIILNLLKYFLLLVLLINLLNIAILLNCRNISSEYWNKYYSSLKRDNELSKEAYGVCPRCKCSEVKFVDGIKYKCAKCGFLY